VAQFGSAFGWGPKGRWFKSSRPDLRRRPTDGWARTQVSYAEARLLDDSGRLIGHGPSTVIAVPGQGFEIEHPQFVEE
jgi:hypothetical protein